MNSSIRFADQTTHIKIVAVSLIAAILVVAIGIGARDFAIDENAVLIKAAKAVNFSTNTFQWWADAVTEPEPYANASCREADS